ncbi:Transcriptional regulator [Seminavis robusta]|uniref:Transcriptional regulator n=1 Tax=Seminavis robusta TaxID=568900 RepID=A0A9N8D7A5_9STRA|nr:Transcriptional regulator [Seminavis robusta]|eukprot:Sro26_g017800.1 Transcriptional regulator (547) ;mRNA; r:128192-129966
MSLQKLKWSRVGLYGRKTEVEQLGNVLEKVTSGGSRTLVLIDGASGTGKTALAEQLKEPIKRAQGFLVLGKFDLQQMREPFSGIKVAMDQLCGYILALKEELRSGTGCHHLVTLSENIIKELGKENILLLSNLVPSLLQVGAMGPQETQQNKQQETPAPVGGSETLDQLNFAFRTLVKSWIGDIENTSLMIVGCFRSNEAHKDLDEMTQDIEVFSLERNSEILKIHLGDLDQESAQAFIADVLNMDPDRIQSLSDIVYHKTGGKIFYLIHFIQSLATAGLLSFQFWIGNVVDLMKQKLQSNSAAILPKAACLGARFGFDAICIVINNQESATPILDSSGEVINTATQVRQALQECLDERFLEACPGDVFAFPHDKVQEAALALLGEKALPEIRFAIGDLLLTHLGGNELGNLIFPVANLMSEKAREMPIGNLKRKEIAKLHVRAGSMAMNYAAFEAATKYFETAMELLPEDHWSTDFELSLTLFTSAAETQCCIGNFSKMKGYCQQVLNEPKSPASTQTHIYGLLATAAFTEENYNKAIDFCFLIV